MSQPVRLQLSRRKGFDLQALSLGTNGRDAVKVARPSKWGNPFTLHDKQGRRIRSNVEAVAEFRELMGPQPENVARLYVPHRLIVRELRGKNLACWCHAEDVCHADVLIELANGPICEAIEKAGGIR